VTRVPVLDGFGDPIPGRFTEETTYSPYRFGQANAILRQELAARFRTDLKRYGIRGRRLNELVRRALAAAGLDQPRPQRGPRGPMAGSPGPAPFPGSVGNPSGYLGG
jgi:hypothetical protein